MTNPKITSKLLPASEPLTAEFCLEAGIPAHLVGKTAVYTAFSTRVGDKTVLTAIGLGTSEGVSPVGRKGFELVVQNMTGKVVLLECRDVMTARQRAVKALLDAENGDGLLIMCNDQQIYDAVGIVKTFGLTR